MSASSPVESIDGTGNNLLVEKQGDGTLVLSGSNSFTGLLRLEGGTLVMANGNALGALTATSDIRVNNTAPSTSSTLEIRTDGGSGEPQIAKA